MTSRNFRVKLTPSFSVKLGHKSRTPHRNYVTSLQLLSQSQKWRRRLAAGSKCRFNSRVGGR